MTCDTSFRFGTLWPISRCSISAVFNAAPLPNWARSACDYTDEKSVPVVTAIAKLAAALPSSIASLDLGKSGPDTGKTDQSGVSEKGGEIVAMPSQSGELSKAVPSWENLKLVPKGGLEPPCG